MHVTRSAAALFLIGLDIGLVYPNLVHLTPRFVKEAAAQPVMEIQQATSCTGILLMPWLFGVLTQALSMALMPYDLIVLCGMHAVSFVLLMRKAA